MAGPTILHATDKAGTRRPIVGRGEFTYEVYHDWGKLPAGLKYGNTHGVAEDSAGPHLRAPHRARDHGPARHDGRLRREGRVRPQLGQAVRGRRARAAHPEGGARTSSCILCDTKRATVTKMTPRGRGRVGARLSEGVSEVPGERGRLARREVLADQRRRRPRRRHLRRRRLRLELHQSIRRVRASTSAPSAARARKPGQIDCPHGLIVDSAGRDAGAARRGPRATAGCSGSRSTARTSGFDDGFPHPCHFSEHKGTMVVPDLFAKVTLIDRREQRDRRTRRQRPRFVEGASHRAARGLSRSASSSARTARASITPATSSSWSGSRSGA